MVKAGASKGKSPRPIEGNLIDDDIDEGPTVTDQIGAVEDILRKLNLVKKERTQILKDLKDKVGLNADLNMYILTEAGSLRRHL
jgi:programmed cell death 6-interacting protein